MHPSLISLRKSVGRIGRRLPITRRILEAQRVRTRTHVLRSMPPNSVCAEIGVWSGSFSAEILDIVRPRMLHLIDPWAFQAEASEAWYGGKLANEQAYMDAVYAQVLATFGGRDNVTIHRTYSSEAASLFELEYFDWIYVDGDHHYEHVKADLEDYLPLVKRSGYLTGDDYYWGAEHGLPVKRSVEEIVSAGAVELVSVAGSQFILKKL
jgi:Methyltransferase domain